MKFTLTVRHVGGDDTWDEPYDEPNIETQEQAERRAHGMLEYFNSTLRPGERARELVSVAIVGVSTEHDWQKSSLVTQSDHIGLYDRMQCSRCYITGKRFGVSPHIKRDSKYRARKYEQCAGHDVTKVTDQD